jgi:hypothetical protein
MLNPERDRVTATVAAGPALFQFPDPLCNAQKARAVLPECFLARDLQLLPGYYKVKPLSSSQPGGTAATHPGSRQPTLQSSPRRTRQYRNAAASRQGIHRTFSQGDLL